MASIWDRLFSQEDYRTAAPSGGYADLYQDGLLARNRDEMPASVKAAQAGKDFVPLLSDVLAFGEAGHALSEGDRKRAAILAAGGLLGTIPGAGPFVARPVMAAGRKVAERLNQTGPVPTMYSNPLMGGGASDPTQTGWTFKDMDKSLNSITTKADNRRMSGDTSRVEDVPINQLLATQPSVNPDFATTASSAGELPFVVRKNGKMFVQDGHHRLTKKAEDGSQTAKVRFLDLDDADTSTPLLDWSPEKTGFVEADNDLLDALFSPSLPAPRNEAEVMAQKVLEMRAAGNAGDVTEDMMAAADDTYMYNNTPLPMDEASRMARAEEMGFGGDMYHGTDDSFSAFRDSRERGLQGKGVYAANNYSDAESFIEGVVREELPSGTYRTSEIVSYPEGANVIPARMSGEPYDFERVNSVDPFSQEGEALIGRLGLRGKKKYLEGGIADQRYDNSSRAASRIAPEYTDEWMDELRRLENAKSAASGYSGNLDAYTGHQTVFDPSNVRSRFARFDPEFKHLRNLSAGVGGVGLLNAMMEEEQRQQQGLLQ